MNSLDLFVDELLARGRATFAREEAAIALGLGEAGLKSALVRLGKRNRIANPYKGFYLILRPEQVVFGAPDPAEWIGHLMGHIGIDYRVSLLRAAALHGSSHQAAMVFQVIVPKQLRDFEIGRQRLQFVMQAPDTFSAVNQPEFLARIRTRAGEVKASGIELTLLDAARYSSKACGVNGVAQMAMAFGGEANPRRLSQLARHYETPCVRRLGYLLEYFHHDRQARVLEPFAASAKTTALLDPAAKLLIESLAEDWERNSKWKLLLNGEVEIDL